MTALPRPGRPEVACVGNFVLDILVHPFHGLPPSGHLATVDSVELHGGGAGFATAVALSRLSARVEAVGAVGRDPAGEQLRRWLATERVRTGYLTTVDSPTASTVCLVAPDGERTYLHNPGASRDVSLATFDADLGNLDALHIGSALILPGLDQDDAALQVLSAANQAGVITSMDTSWDSTGQWDRVLRYLPHLQVFCPSLVEARQISGLEDPAAVAQWLRSRGAKAAVLTDGARGAYVDSVSFTGWVGTPVVAVVDSTGAGECFNAGLIAGLCAGWPVEVATQLGCAVGATATTAVGALGAITDLDAALALANIDVDHGRAAGGPVQPRR